MSAGNIRRPQAPVKLIRPLLAPMPLTELISVAMGYCLPSQPGADQKGRQDDFFLTSGFLKGALLGLFAAAALSCGGSNKGESTTVDGLGGALAIPNVNPELCDIKGKRVEVYDLNRDGKPDVWKLFEKVDEGGTKVEVLTCKQIDYDHDGSKDYVATYERTGELIAEEIDLTFDGRFDAREHYNEKTGKLRLIERDSDHDKQPDVWEEYDDTGALTAVRMDRNADGNPDLWEQYDKGELTAILYDDDFDSRVDRKETRGAAPKPTSLPPAPTTSPDAEAPAEGGEEAPPAIDPTEAPTAE